MNSESPCPDNLRGRLDERDHRLFVARMRSVKRVLPLWQRACLGCGMSAAWVAALWAGGYPPARLAAFVVAMLAGVAMNHWLHDDRRPAIVAVHLLPSFAAVAITGGVLSPLFPPLIFGVAPIVMFMAHGERRLRWLWGGALAIALLIALPPPLRGPPLAEPYGVLLTGGSMLYAIWVVATLLRHLDLSDAWLTSEIRHLRGDLLHEALERSRTFEAVAAKVGHELKTPLSAIRVLAELEQKHADDERGRERLATMLSETRRMQEIVDDYLVLAKPVESIEVAEYDLSSVVLDVATTFAASAERASVRIETRGDGPVPMLGDRRRMREAITNLVSNALHASAAGSRVTVEIEADEELAWLLVRDSGAGIPPHLMPRVGEAFFTTRQGGTGLGLVLARTVVMQHGGRLSIDSEQGKGTLVHVVLPRQVEARDLPPTTQMVQARATPRAA